MYPQWIQACVVQRVSLRDGLVLDFDDCNEVVIYRPEELSRPVDRGVSGDLRSGLLIAV